MNYKDKDKLLQLMSAKGKAACEICNQSFTFLINSEHQCKRCKRSVCKNCGKYKEKIVLSLQQTVFERCCVLCKEDMEYQKTVIQTNKTQWNWNSLLAKSWIKINSIDVLQGLYEEVKKDWKESLQAGNTTTIQNADLINQEFQKMYTELGYWNYSMVDWISNSQKQGVLKPLIGSFLLFQPKVGFSKDIYMMAYFLLTFVQDYVAYFILKNLYTSIIPEVLLPTAQISSELILVQGGLVSESLASFQQQFKVTPGDLPVVKKFMEYYLIQYKASMFLNFLDFQCVFGIISQLLELGQFFVIDRYFIIMVKLNLLNLRKAGVSKALLLLILRETKFKCTLFQTDFLELKELDQQIEEQQQKEPLLVTPRNVQMRKTVVLQSPPISKESNNNIKLSGHKQNKSQTYNPFIKYKSMANLNYGPESRRLKTEAFQDEDDDDFSEPQIFQKDYINLNMSYSSIPKSNRSIDDTGERSKEKQIALQEQQTEISKLRAQIKEKENNIKQIFEENAQLAQQVKSIELRHINYQRNCYEQFEKLENLESTQMTEQIKKIEDSILKLQQLQTAMLKQK